MILPGACCEWSPLPGVRRSVPACPHPSARPSIRLQVEYLPEPVQFAVELNRGVGRVGSADSLADALAAQRDHCIPANDA